MEGVVYHTIVAARATHARQAVGMSRGAVACIAVLAALLVFDGGALPAGSHPGATTGRTEAEGARVDAAMLAEYLAQVNPALSDRQLERIAAAVVANSEKYALDPALVVGVILAESSARPWARSPKGAVGLMQVMPYMMGSLEIAGNLTSVESNIEAGCLILADNIRRLGERRGILAYFWGNDIRGVSYFDRVQKARAALLRQAS